MQRLDFSLLKGFLNRFETFLEKLIWSETENGNNPL